MSSSTADRLVYMANQIATFFASQPQEEAVQGVVEHINSFWDPRMREQLFAIAEKGGSGLSPLVLEAMPQIRKVRPNLTVPGHA
ncbi:MULTISPECIES: formate dehydrogenase subunit delta [Rhodomicrobium]|uniref:formate dehydrogenase subunit delta n=1 Tax=Rhodomicrobium TaxID=1068 RepID=UPI000B4A5A1D|nr:MULTISPECIES: formate dehydrogenase subunit delta [Rhodomicrobium]